MLKRIFSVALTLLFFCIPSYAADTLFFEAYTDGWNSSGAGRYGQGKVLRMQIEAPWEYIGKATTPAEAGGDGVLPQNWDEFQKYGKTVYWIQSAVFPDDDQYVRCADSSLDDPYILPKGTTSSGVTTANSAPESFEGTVKYVTKVRFDDYNAHRYILSPYNKEEKKYNDFLWFDKNGKAYAMCLIDGVATAKEICTWSVGEWYDVELILNFDYESISVSINGGKQIQNAQAKDMRDWTYLMLLNLKHENHSVSEREFSNSYISGAKGYYLSENTPAPSDSGYYYTIDFTWNTGSVGRVGQGKALQINPRQPWIYSGESTATNIGNEGMLPFEDEYRGVKKVYLLRTGVWPEDDTEAVILGDNSIGVPRACTIYNTTNLQNTFIESEENRETNTVQWEMKVRFDDANSLRRLFVMKEDAETNLVSVNRDGTISAKFKNGDTISEYSAGKWVIGKWHMVKLCVDLKLNVFSLYLDSLPIVTNVLAPCKIEDCVSMKLMQQEHTTSNAQITQREFSNAYIDFVKAKYIPDKEYLWTEKEEVSYSGGKYNANLSVTNINSDENHNIKCFMALYDNLKLVGIKSTSVELEGVKTKNVNFSLPYSSSGAEAKVFVLNQSTLTPIPDGEGVSTFVPSYYFTLDFTDNNSGYSRGGYTKVIGCGRAYVWDYIGTSVSSAIADIGGEGILPFDNALKLGGNYIYWIKTGIWPENDTEAVRNANRGTNVPKKAAPYVFVGPEELVKSAEERDSDIVQWDIKVRFDDKNATRSIFRMYNTKGSLGTPFIQFATDGKFKVTYCDGEENKTVEKFWNEGVWYNVTLRINFTENLFSVYLNDEKVVENADAVNGIDFDGWSRMYLLEHSHQTDSSDITKREFSNSYIATLKAQYIE